MRRMIGPRHRNLGHSGNYVRRVTSRQDRRCATCGRSIPAGTPHVVHTACPAYADELGYGPHWLTERTHGESPRACPAGEAEHGLTRWTFYDPRGEDA